MNYSTIYKNDLKNVIENIPGIDSIKGKKILITGATGLVCSAVVDFLLHLNETKNAGVTVYIAARSQKKARNRFGGFLNRDDVIFVEYDALNDLCWNFNVDYIIHGASPANPSLYVKEPVETMLANILGMNNILKYASEHKIERVLFVSSSEVYGKKENNHPYGDEEYGYLDILNPRACYPSAKRACETLCVSYGIEHLVDSVIVRLGHIYGPTATRKDTRASSQFFFDVLDGNDIVMKSAGTQLRSYCYVVDCVSAMMTVLIKGEKGKAYNISNPESVVTIRELAEQIAVCANRNVKFVNPSEQEQRGYNLMDNSSLDASLLLDLGWRGMFDLKTGVRHTLEILSVD